MASAAASTLSILARMVATAPVISSTLSPRMRMAIKKPPICAGVASPDIILSKACVASSRVRWAPVATLPMSARKRSMSAALRRVPLGGEIEKILQNGLAVLGGDAFGMELHAVHRMLLVRHRHHEPVVGLGGDFELGGHAIALDDERVITRRLERRVDAAQHPFTLVLDGRELAVHGNGGAHPVAAIGAADRLVAEADAENRHAVAEPLDEFERNTGFFRGAGTGRNYDRVGARLGQRIDGDLVVPMHFDLGPEHADGMHEVPGEAVIVIDERDFRHWREALEGALVTRRRARVKKRLLSAFGAARETARFFGGVKERPRLVDAFLLFRLRI